MILLPAAFGALYVRTFGVSVVYSDAWSMVPLFDKWSSGTLQVWDLFKQHNEHRMFFPRAVEILLGSITNYNTVAEMYLIQVCLFASLLILFFAFRDSIKSAWLFLFIPISLLIFSYRQYENMLFGYQINFAFAQTFGVLALFLLYISGRRGSKKLAFFMAALVSATVASFSLLSGLFVWPAGLLQLFISPLERPIKKVLILLWSLIGLGEYVAFFIGWVKPGSVSFLDTLEHPVLGTQYFLTLLGSSLFWEQSAAFVGGSLVALLALISLLLIQKDGRLREYSFWISLLLYSLLILTAITGGRSVNGTEVVSPRYTSFPIFAVASVYAMLVKTAFERRSHTNTILLVAFCGVILLSAYISYPNGIKSGREYRAHMKQAAFVLSTYESQPCKLVAESLHEPDHIVRERAPILQRLGYNVFSDSQAPGTPPPLLIYYGWDFDRNRC